MTEQSIAVVMDYQNIHLTAHECFCPTGLAAHESLIHPLHFANQLVLARQAAMRERRPDLASEDCQLVSVDVFRGLPTNKEQPAHYRRSQAQQSEWTRDRRVQVTYRPLRYRWRNGERHIQEKGVDVLTALHFVRLVQEVRADVVILAAHDTDLEPALEFALESEAVQSGKVRIETAGWKDCKRIKPSGPKRVTLWHTFLGPENFVRSRDRRDYSFER